MIKLMCICHTFMRDEYALRATVVVFGGFYLPFDSAGTYVVNYDN